MNGLDYKSFFVHPVDTVHQRYEALRAVFVEQQTMKEVAGRYDVSYGTIRNWVNEYCRGRDAGQSPPFSLHHRAGVPRPVNCLPMTRIRQSKSPTFRRCRWRQDDG